MDELIKVDFSSDRPLVSARDLHAFLEVKTAYKDWFPRMCEYGFTEGIDFSSNLSESTGGRPAHDAALTIDMAKEICMLQRNDKGKQARQYFLRLPLTIRIIRAMMYNRKGGGNVRFREVEKILLDDGWYEVGQKGSHHHYKHPTKPGKIPVPEHAGKDINPNIVKQIFKQAGL